MCILTDVILHTYILHHPLLLRFSSSSSSPSGLSTLLPSLALIVSSGFLIPNGSLPRVWIWMYWVRYHTIAPAPAPAPALPPPSLPPPPRLPARALSDASFSPISYVVDALSLNEYYGLIFGCTSSASPSSGQERETGREIGFGPAMRETTQEDERGEGRTIFDGER